MTFWLVLQSHEIMLLDQVPRGEVVAKTSGYMGHVKEATEIKFLPDNINREEGFKLSKAWNPSTSLL
jgi:hypothetical protein